MNKNALTIIAVIIISLILASMANIYPLDFAVAMFRPMFMIVVLIFWVLYQPRFVGISIAFLVGLLCDLLLDTMLGSQAFSVVAAVLLVQNLRILTKKLTLSSSWIIGTAGLVVYRLFMWVFELFSYEYVGFSAVVGLLMSILIFPFVWTVLSKINNAIDNQQFI